MNEKALMKELTRRIRMYERLIDEPETLSLDELKSCKICVLVSPDNEYVPACDSCPLRTILVDDGTGHSLCMTQARERLSAYCWDNTAKPYKIKRAAMQRLKEMLKAIKLAGYEYK